MLTDAYSAKILNLPTQKIYERKNQFLTDEQRCIKLRLCGVTMIQMMQAGQMRRDKDKIQTLKDINRSLEDYGEPTLPLDFLD